MIELTTDPVDGKHLLTVNGQVVPDDAATIFGGHKVSVIVKDRSLSRTLLAHRYVDFQESVESLTFAPGFIDLPPEVDIDVYFSESGARLSAVRFFGALDWREPYSIGEFMKTFQVLATEGGLDTDFTVETDTQEESLGLFLMRKITNLEQTLIDDVQHLARAYTEVHRKTFEIVVRHSLPGSLVSVFDFPSDISVPCSQYLLYFVQFLRDMGVQAKGEIKEVQGRTLFSVTPTDGYTALHHIREALDSYLRIPSASIQVMDAGDPRMQQMMANVEHLRGQLMLAKASLQLKDATIEQMQLTIAMQRQYASGEIVSASLRTITGDTDQEPLLGGTVSLSKYEGKGFEINLAEVYRRIKQLLAKP